MQHKYIFLFTFCGLLIMAVSCNSPIQKKTSVKVHASSLLHFEYRGYGDTVFAMIDGTVFAPDSLSPEGEPGRPLSGVKVTVTENKKMTETDAQGQFSIGLGKGIYSLILTKKGYQTLMISNYRADPDQVSVADIMLVKGSVTQRSEIPPPKE